MELDFLFILLVGIGTIVYVGYMVKNRNPKPKQIQTQALKPEPEQLHNLLTLQTIEEKNKTLEDELHDLKVAWKLKPNQKEV